MTPPTFAEMQAAFQRAILEGDDAVLAELTDGAHEPRTAMFAVYRNAYLLRLVEAMRKEHEILHTFLGDDTFDEMAAAYLAAHPSRHPNVRWVSRHLPTFLAQTEPYGDYPVVAELTALEKALNDAFDAPDATVLTGDDLAAIPPDSWQDVIVAPHPSAKRLSLSTNAAAIWTALRQDETPPDAAASEATAELLVWRHETTPMWRELSREEAMMWDEAAGAMAFGQVCVMLATFDDPDNAAARAAGYLGAWVGAGLLASATVVAAQPAAPAVRSHRSM